jgi:hypothetical protein
MPGSRTAAVYAACLTSRSVGLDGTVARRSKTKKRPSFGIPREIILLTGQDVWLYTFRADDSGGGCGKVAMPSDTAVEEVQAAVFTSLADIIPTLHDVGIEIVWSSLPLPSPAPEGVEWIEAYRHWSH